MTKDSSLRSEYHPDAILDADASADTISGTFSSQTAENGRALIVLVVAESIREADMKANGRK